MRLSPSVLAQEFGASHIPVREALSSLAAKGFVEHRQARGYFTRVLSSEELADIYHWRKVLESEALQLAMPLITEADLDEMRSIVRKEEKMTSSEDRLEYLALNRQFHFVAFERAGSPILLRLLNSLWDISHPYVATEMTDSSRSHSDHVRQLEIFESGNVDEMLIAMDEHRSARQDLVRQWEKRMQKEGRLKADSSP